MIYPILSLGWCISLLAVHLHFAWPTLILAPATFEAPITAYSSMLDDF